MSFFGKLLHPVYQLISAVLAFYYGLEPNYALAITLLTLTVMVLVVPLTVKSTRSMLAMQQVQPEIKEIQRKYKDDRMAMNEAMTSLMRERGVSPAGGCLPMLLQLPVFIVLYEVIRGLAYSVHGVPSPKYIGHQTLLYSHLIADGGHMPSLGIDLARSATSVHGSFLAALPYYGILAIAIGLQYLQIAQMSRRSPQQTGANASMMRMQKFLPLIYVVIYIAIPAGVNVYFVVSSAFRIAQQTLMYRYDPVVRSTMASLRTQQQALPAAAGGPAAGDAAPARRPSLREMARQAMAARETLAAVQPGQGSPQSTATSGARAAGRPQGAGRSQAGTAGRAPGAARNATPGSSAGAKGRKSPSGSARTGGDRKAAGSAPPRREPREARQPPRPDPNGRAGGAGPGGRGPADLARARRAR